MTTKNKTAKNAPANPFLSPEPIDVNLIMTQIAIQPIATLPIEPILIGIPIMREGFITETGLMISATGNQRSI